MSGPRIHTEFELVIASCRWPQNDWSRDRLRRLAAAGPDWANVLENVRAHRVAGLTRRAISAANIAVPAQFLAELDGLADRVSSRGYRHLAESLRLKSAFEESGINTVFLKGIPLAQICYGDVTLKFSWDIDLLVAQNDVLQSAEILKELGYSADIPSSAPEHWLLATKELEFVNEERGVVVELHWRLADHSRLLATIESNPRVLSVPVFGSHDLPTLGPAENLAYLAVHGAAHGWSRLKWLADFSAFCASFSPRELAEHYDNARELNAARCVNQALVLAHGLLDFTMEPSLEKEVMSDRTARWMAQSSRRVQMNTNVDVPIENQPGSMARIQVMNFFLHPGLRFKLMEIARRWRGNSRDALEHRSHLRRLRHLVRRVLRV